MLTLRRNMPQNSQLDTCDRRKTQTSIPSRIRGAETSSVESSTTPPTGGASEESESGASEHGDGSLTGESSAETMTAKISGERTGDSGTAGGATDAPSGSDETSDGISPAQTGSGEVTRDGIEIEGQGSHDKTEKGDSADGSTQREETEKGESTHSATQKEEAALQGGSESEELESSTQDDKSASLDRSKQDDTAGGPTEGSTRDGKPASRDGQEREELTEISKQSEEHVSSYDGTEREKPTGDTKESGGEVENIVFRAINAMEFNEILGQDNVSDEAACKRIICSRLSGESCQETDTYLKALELKPQEDSGYSKNGLEEFNVVYRKAKGTPIIKCNTVLAVLMKHIPGVQLLGEDEDVGKEDGGDTNDVISQGKKQRKNADEKHAYEQRQSTCKKLLGHLDTFEKSVTINNFVEHGSFKDDCEELLENKLHQLGNQFWEQLMSRMVNLDRKVYMKKGRWNLEDLEKNVLEECEVMWQELLRATPTAQRSDYHRDDGARKFDFDKLGHDLKETGSRLWEELQKLNRDTYDEKDFKKGNRDFWEIVPLLLKLDHEAELKRLKKEAQLEQEQREKDKGDNELRKKKCGEAWGKLQMLKGHKTGENDNLWKGLAPNSAGMCILKRILYQIDLEVRIIWDYVKTNNWSLKKGDFRKPDGQWLITKLMAEAQKYATESEEETPGKTQLKIGSKTKNGDSKGVHEKTATEDDKHEMTYTFSPFPSGCIRFDDDAFIRYVDPLCDGVFDIHYGMVAGKINSLEITKSNAVDVQRIIDEHHRVDILFSLAGVEEIARKSKEDENYPEHWTADRNHYGSSQGSITEMTLASAPLFVNGETNPVLWNQMHDRSCLLMPAFQCEIETCASLLCVEPTCMREVAELWISLSENFLNLQKCTIIAITMGFTRRLITHSEIDAVVDLQNWKVPEHMGWDMVAYCQELICDSDSVKLIKDCKEKMKRWWSLIQHSDLYHKCQYTKIQVISEHYQDHGKDLLKEVEGKLGYGTNSRTLPKSLPVFQEAAKYNPELFAQCNNPYYQQTDHAIFQCIAQKDEELAMSCHLTPLECCGHYILKTTGKNGVNSKCNYLREITASLKIPEPKQSYLQYYHHIPIYYGGSDRDYYHVVYPYYFGCWTYSPVQEQSTCTSLEGGQSLDSYLMGPSQDKFPRNSLSHDLACGLRYIHHFGVAHGTVYPKHVFIVGGVRQFDIVLHNFVRSKIRPGDIQETENVKTCGLVSEDWNHEVQRDWLQFAYTAITIQTSVKPNLRNFLNWETNLKFRRNYLKKVKEIYPEDEGSKYFYDLVTQLSTKNRLRDEEIVTHRYFGQLICHENL